MYLYPQYPADQPTFKIGDKVKATPAYLFDPNDLADPEYDLGKALYDGADPALRAFMDGQASTVVDTHHDTCVHQITIENEGGRSGILWEQWAQPA